MTQAEEEPEPVLLMASATLFPNSSPTCAAAVLPPTPRPSIRIVEAKVFAQLDGEAERDDTQWYLDSGATNHMSRCRSAFVNIDKQIQGTIRFGDGSEVAIEGSGAVVFQAKNGERTQLAGVYYIPRLTTSIVSLGQLDEGGSDINIKDGVFKIRD